MPATNIWFKDELYDVLRERCKSKQCNVNDLIIEIVTEALMPKPKVTKVGNSPVLTLKVKD